MTFRVADCLQAELKLQAVVHPDNSLDSQVGSFGAVTQSLASLEVASSSCPFVVLESYPIGAYLVDILAEVVASLPVEVEASFSVKVASLPVEVEASFSVKVASLPVEVKASFSVKNEAS